MAICSVSDSNNSSGSNRFTVDLHKISIKKGSFLPFVKSIKALSKKRDKTVSILRLLSYF